jgi:hypothetical protein
MLYSSWNKGSFYIIAFIVIVFTYCRETSQCYNGSCCWGSTVFCKLLLIQHLYQMEFGLGSLEQSGSSLQAAGCLDVVRILISSISFIT